VNPLGGVDIARPATVVISGGSRGLGRVLVEAYLDQGCRVATFSRATNDYLAARRLRDEAEASFLWRPVDATQPDAVRAFVDVVEARFGRIDVLINNAAALSEGLLALVSDEEVSRLIHANLLSTISLTRACARLMIRERQGAIVNVSSINSVRGFAGVSVYSATKAAIDALTRSLARELGPRNIRVNSIAPGFFESDLVANLKRPLKEKIAHRTPLGRLSRVDEVADAVLYMASPRASFITGQTLVVDGGITC
jgi:3-oxoacyl-[acyl-carrier protein] reductase